MDRGGEWTEVVSGQRWRVDRVHEWTMVMSGQRLYAFVLTPPPP